MNEEVCTFYSKIGACRHGDKCSRSHIKPIQSKSIILRNFYPNPRVEKDKSGKCLYSQKQIQDKFDEFYKDIYQRIASMGVIDAIVVCENEVFHMNGNVYVKFTTKDEAYNACQKLNQMWYNGRPVYCELSPVERFNGAICKLYQKDACNRGDMCNFMHVRYPNHKLKSMMQKSQDRTICETMISKLVAEIEKDKENNKHKNDTNSNAKINSNGAQADTDTSNDKSNIIDARNSNVAPTSASTVEALFKV